MPSKKKQPARQPVRATRQSARQLAQPKDDIPDVYNEMLAEVAEEEKAAASQIKSAERRSTRMASQPTRQRAKPEDEVPAVYAEMVAEAIAEEQSAALNPRPSKRRKTSEEPSGKIELDIDLFGESADVGDPIPTEPESAQLQQVTLTEFDTDAESEVEFEDVDLNPAAEEADDDDQPEQKPLELDLSKVTTPKRAPPRRKPVSAAERRLRLYVHKAHIIMLLAHLKCRNQWCNSESVQTLLKPLVSRKTTNLLHVDERKTQYERNQSFMKGIEEVFAIWEDQWTSNGRGMSRAYWRDDVNILEDSDDAEDLEFSDFKSAAVSKQGSRDLGAELFCALLRSVAVDTRLVCSLQALPFSAVAKGQTPEKPKAGYIRAPPQDYGSTSGTPAQKQKVFEQSMYPIFWVEVFSPAIQTWIALDPMVRYTINKPKTGFEPPANDNLNRMAYVLAFEDDGSAKDVTKRYTQFFTSKIRKQRVESTPGGEKWWTKTMSALEKPFREARDDIEDVYLQKRTESEPMPNNIEDFRGHPVYVLERHLRKTEVIHPRRESGKVTIGFGKNAKLVSVFRRRDLHVCRTADAWYRRGRDVNEGEQPLKRAIPRRMRAPVADAFDDDEEEAADGTALYAEFQTSLYEPPPIVNGKVPRNAYGNLDVYVPSMIPAGAVHVRHPLAASAARLLGIDYVDAVTGFQFKGRQGTAVVDGVVISMTMTNAMITVIDGLESQATDEAQEMRSKIMLAIWKRWLIALRVKEHVQRKYGGREEDTKSKARELDDEDDDDIYRPEDDGGGFMLDGAKLDEADEEAASLLGPSMVPDLKPLELPPEVVHQKVIIARSPNKLLQLPVQDQSMPQLRGNEAKSPVAEDEGSVFEGEPEEGGFLPEDDTKSTLTTRGQPTIARTEEADEEGGGFLPEDDEEGGGFLPDEEDEAGGGFMPEAGDDTAETAAADNAIAKLANGNGSTLEKLPLALIDQIQQPTKPGSATPDQKEGLNKESPASAPTPGSLLSHDPEEDDAEPEWLLNSLGEIE